MLSFPGTQVFLVAGVTDMRKSFRGLPAIVENALGKNPLDGVYVFCNYVECWIMRSQLCRVPGSPVRNVVDTSELKRHPT